MSLSSRLFRRVLPIVAIAVVAVLVAGCDWAEASAATIKVGGKTYTISQSSLVDQIKAKKSDDPVKSSAAARVLSLRIQYTFWEHEARKRGLKIDPAEVAKVEKQAPSSAGNKAFIRWAARAQVAQTMVLAELAKEKGPARDKAERALYEQIKDQQQKVCFEYLVSPKADAVNKASDAIKGGATFADSLQQAKTVDPQAEVNGDQPTCTTPQVISQQLPKELADPLTSAKVNTLIGPIEVQGQDPNTGAPQSLFVVARVTQRGTPTFDELRPQLDQNYAQARGAQLQRAWLEKADISVNPRYGRWDAKNFQVVPPSGLPKKFSKLLDQGTPPPSTIPGLPSGAGGASSAP